MSIELPENFRSLVVDFTNDLTTTFPEWSYIWSKWGDEDITDDELLPLYTYCMKVYPARFFDILYKNADMFKEDSGIDVYFLPNISFRLLFSEEGLSDKSKDILWNYLQLVLFTVVGNVKDKTSFGEAMNMFEGIDSGTLQDKLKDVMENIGTAFEKIASDTETPTKDDESKDDQSRDESSNTSSPNVKEGFQNMFGNMGDFAKKFPFSKMAGMPDIGKLQEHLQTLFEGKIGRLAQELAEEVSGEFKDLLGGNENLQNPQEVIKELMKNPNKISKLMKTVSSRLDEKMKSGEISREEIMKEASEMMNKMNADGDGEGLAEMFKNLAKGMGMGKNMKVDTNAITRMTKMSATKDRIRQTAMKAKQRQAETQAANEQLLKQRMLEQEQLRAKYSLNQAGGANNFVFKLEGESQQEKSFTHPDLINEMLASDAKVQSGAQKKTGKGKGKGKGKK
jgi:hypothetical protein